jgi:hypothetical protein
MRSDPRREPDEARGEANPPEKASDGADESAMFQMVLARVLSSSAGAALVPSGEGAGDRPAPAPAVAPADPDRGLTESGPGPGSPPDPIPFPFSAPQIEEALEAASHDPRI